MGQDLPHQRKQNAFPIFIMITILHFLLDMPDNQPGGNLQRSFFIVLNEHDNPSTYFQYLKNLITSLTYLTISPLLQ